MKRFIGICIFLLLAACDIPVVEHHKTEPPLLCGNAIGGNDDGRALFMANCASCHNPLKDATGPALRGTFSNWNHDTTAFREYLRNPGKYMQHSRNQRLTELHKRFGYIAHPPFRLSDADINDIISYIE